MVQGADGLEGDADRRLVAHIQDGLGEVGEVGASLHGFDSAAGDDDRGAGCMCGLRHTQVDACLASDNNDPLAGQRLRGVQG